MNIEQAEFNNLPHLFNLLAKHLDQFQRFEHADAMHNVDKWQEALEKIVPLQGIGAERVS